jgi:hypothetical protein
MKFQALGAKRRGIKNFISAVECPPIVHTEDRRDAGNQFLSQFFNKIADSWRYL